MKNKLLIFISIIFLSQACMFYTIKGSLPAHIQSIYLAPVTNESTEFIVAEIFNKEINRMMIEKNVLNIVSIDHADSQLKVVVKSVKDAPRTISLSDDMMEQVEAWDVIISAKVLWYDIERNEIIIEEEMSSKGMYVSGVDISNDNIDNDFDNLIDGEDSDEQGSPRESALKISTRLLTEDIIDKITNTW
tara:strand:+ start:2524 stop:3093 length:570 start_codon:yes stop_codon:yes gene_type:complete